MKECKLALGTLLGLYTSKLVQTSLCMNMESTNRERFRPPSYYSSVISSPTALLTVWCACSLRQCKDR